MTIVAITQRPSLLRSVDKIMILKDGAVQVIGARDEVLPMVTGRKPASNNTPTRRPSGGTDAPMMDA